MSEAAGTATQEYPAEGFTVDLVPLYPLDQTEIEVSIVSGKTTLGHKLNKPTLAQLLERESQLHYESEAINDNEERINSDDEQANARLWDAIASSVRGYKLNKADTHPVNEWRELTPELKAAIPGGHKATAIRAMYQSACEIEKDEDEGFTLSVDIWTVRQTFGDPDNPNFVVRHVLRTPDEKERRAFKQKSSQVSFSKGTRRQKTRVTTNLKSYVELYDGLYAGIDGVTGSTALPGIDPIWKRQVIDCLMKSFEAGLKD